MKVTMQRQCMKCGRLTPRFSGPSIELVQLELDRYCDEHGWFVGKDSVFCAVHAGDKTVKLSI
jgi:hypothetical protein